MSATDIIIRVENLYAGYDDVAIQENVNFEVRRGEVFGILGGSGSGKTTIMKHMIGLIEPISGHVYIDGDDIVTADEATRAAILRRFGVMYQSGALFGSMTLLENVRLPLEEYTDLPDDAIDLVARMKLELVGLEGFTGHLPAELSGGMQKRAGIARAMALDPSILFMDEPSSGLDPIVAAEMDELILFMKRMFNMTMLVVTHELASAFRIADRIAMLHEGSLIAVDENETFRASTDPRVRQFLDRVPDPVLDSEAFQQHLRQLGGFTGA